MGDHNQLEDFFSGSVGKEKNKDAKSSFIKSLFSFFKDHIPSKNQLKFIPHILSAKERYAVFFLALIALGSLAYLPFAIYKTATYPVPTYGGEMIEGVIGQPSKINPLLAQNNEADKDLVSLLYSGLMRYDDNGILIPDLAKSYDISPDGLTYTFILKDNLKWHDDKDLTVDDVIFTILSIQNSEYGSFQKSNWLGIEVSKKSENSVSFTLKNKYAQFLNNTTLGIIPKHIWENVPPSSFITSDLHNQPIGSGPYKLVSQNKDSVKKTTKNITLESFDNFALGKPYIDSIKIIFYNNDEELTTAFTRGEVDSVSFLTNQRLSSIALGSKTIKEIKIPRYFALFLNQDKQAIFKDRNIRVSIQHATNKQQIIDEVLAGKGSAVESPMLPGIIDITDPIGIYSFNPERAEKIITSAGYTKNDDGIYSKSISGEDQPLSFEITTSNWPDLIATANIIKNQWRNVGIDVKIKISSLQDVQQAIKKRDYEILLFGEVLALDPDPHGFWHSSQSKEGGLNLSNYSNQEADKLLEEARKTTDQRERLEKYNRFQNIVVQDAPAVLLYTSDYLYPQSNTIKGNQVAKIFTPSNRLTSVYKWYIKESRTFTKPTQ